MPLEGIRFRQIAAADMTVLHEQFVEVYRGAFRLPPYSKGEVEVADFAQSLGENTTRRGFMCVGAFAASAGKLIGFAYGCDCQASEGWRERMASVLVPAMAEEWLTDSLHINEFAVLPGYQGRGVGGRLHDLLVAAAPQGRAVLTTFAADTPAARLYLGRGWSVLADELRFADVLRPYRLMGLLIGLRLV